MSSRAGEQAGGRASSRRCPSEGVAGHPTRRAGLHLVQSLSLALVVQQVIQGLCSYSYYGTSDVFDVFHIFVSADMDIQHERRGWGQSPLGRTQFLPDQGRFQKFGTRGKFRRQLHLRPRCRVAHHGQRCVFGKAADSLGGARGHHEE